MNPVRLLQRPLSDQIPFDDRAEEFQWLAQNSSRFQGEWVALRGNRLLSHNIDYSKVSHEVNSLGIEGAMFMFIESQGNEDFVRFIPDIPQVRGMFRGRPGTAEF